MATASPHAACCDVAAAGDNLLLVCSGRYRCGDYAGSSPRRFFDLCRDAALFLMLRYTLLTCRLRENDDTLIAAGMTFR